MFGIENHIIKFIFINEYMQKISTVIVQLLQCNCLNTDVDVTVLWLLDMYTKDVDNNFIFKGQREDG